MKKKVKGEKTKATVKVRIRPTEIVSVDRIEEVKAKTNIPNVYHPSYKLIDDTIEEIKKTRTLTTPFGRKRRFFDRYGDDLLRAAVAYIPQSTASDHINRAAVRIYPQLPESSNILLQVHDEIVIQAKTCDVDRVVDLAKRELSTPIPIDGKDVIIPIDIQVGDNWKDGVAI